MKIEKIKGVLSCECCLSLAVKGYKIDNGLSTAIFYFCESCFDELQKIEKPKPPQLESFTIQLVAGGVCFYFHSPDKFESKEKAIEFYKSKIEVR